jgi:hypothetical protein
MQPDTKEIFETFQQFVRTTLDNYERQFYAITSEHSNNNLFRLYWKPFFDELITESNRLYGLHMKQVENPREYSKVLQKIAEQGLIDFKKLTKTFVSGE